MQQCIIKKWKYIHNMSGNLTMHKDVNYYFVNKAETESEMEITL